MSARWIYLFIYPDCIICIYSQLRQFLFCCWASFFSFSFFLLFWGGGGGGGESNDLKTKTKHCLFLDFKVLNLYIV